MPEVRTILPLAQFQSYTNPGNARAASCSRVSLVSSASAASLRSVMSTVMPTSTNSRSRFSRQQRANIQRCSRASSAPNCITGNSNSARPSRSARASPDSRNSLVEGSRCSEPSMECQWRVAGSHSHIWMPVADRARRNRLAASCMASRALAARSCARSTRAAFHSTSAVKLQHMVAASNAKAKLRSK